MISPRRYSVLHGLGRVTSPIILAFMDVSASWTQVDYPWKLWDHPSVALVLEGLMIWLLIVPATKDLLILLLRLGRRRPRNPCLELLKNLAALAAAVIPILVCVVAYGLTRFTDRVFFEAESANASSGGFCMLHAAYSTVQLPPRTWPEGVVTPARLVILELRRITGCDPDN